MSRATYKMSTLRATDDWFEILKALRDGREVSVRCDCGNECPYASTGIPRDLFVTEDGNMAATIGEYTFWADAARLAE